MQFEEFRQFLDRSSGTVEADEPIPPAFAGARHFRWGLFRLSTKLPRSDSIPADSFSKQGVNVIVFYYGDTDVRTVVALRDLGPGPFTRSNGTVDKFNKHEHLLVLKDSTGATESFRIDPKTVVEGAAGAIDGDRYDPQKGDQLYVLSAAGNGSPEALFIRLK